MSDTHLSPQLLYSNRLSDLNPTITEKKRFKLAGMIYYGNPVHSHEGWKNQNEIGKLWSRFGELCVNYKDEIDPHIVEPDVGYEAHIAYPDQPNEEYHIFVGFMVNGPIVTPIELFYKELPETRYAVFTAKGLEMMKQLDRIYSDWFIDHPYVESYPFMLQRYDLTRFKGLNDPDSEMDFLIPVKERVDEA